MTIVHTAESTLCVDDWEAHWSASPWDHRRGDNICCVVFPGWLRWWISTRPNPPQLRPADLELWDSIRIILLCSTSLIPPKAYLDEVLLCFGNWDGHVIRVSVMRWITRGTFRPSETPTAAPWQPARCSSGSRRAELYILDHTCIRLGETRWCIREPTCRKTCDLIKPGLS